VPQEVRDDGDRGGDLGCGGEGGVEILARGAEGFGQGQHAIAQVGDPAGREAGEPARPELGPDHHPAVLEQAHAVPGADSV